MEFLRSQKVAKFTIRFKKFLRRHTGISISWFPRSAKFYDWDGLASIHNHDFLTDPAFMKAYQRGVKSGGSELNIYWRVHVALWAAHAASKLDGDFIECGVNAGIISSTIMEYLDWNSLNKKFICLILLLESIRVSSLKKKKARANLNTTKILWTVAAM